MWYVPNISAAYKNMTINVSARVLKEEREGGGLEGERETL
jgi:hypothetical protein